MVLLRWKMKLGDDYGIYHLIELLSILKQSIYQSLFSFLMNISLNFSPLSQYKVSVNYNLGMFYVAHLL